MSAPDPSDVALLALLVGDADAVSVEARETLAREGWIVQGPHGLRLSATGRLAAGAAASAAGAAAGRTARASMATFERLDRVLKDCVHAWQCRSSSGVDVPNDHGDPVHDARVQAELAAWLLDALAWFERAAEWWPRFGRYRERLLAAHRRLVAGNRAALAGLESDSIHTLWWQAHGEMLALLGRERAG